MRGVEKEKKKEEKEEQASAPTIPIVFRDRESSEPAACTPGSGLVGPQPSAPGRLRPRVLLAGQCPPTTGGIPTFIGDVLGSTALRDAYRLELVDLAPAARGRLGTPSAAHIRRSLAHAVEVGRRARAGDVVHLNVAAAPRLPLLRTLACAEAARRAGAAVVVHIHSGRVEAAVGDGVYRFLLRRLARRVDAVLVVSASAYHAVRTVVDDVRLVPNGVDTERFRPAAPLSPDSGGLQDDGASRAAGPAPLGSAAGQSGRDQPRRVQPARARSSGAQAVPALPAQGKGGPAAPNALPSLVFAGTVRPEKGLLDLRDALVMLAGGDAGRRLPVQVRIIGDSRQAGAGVDAQVRWAFAEAGLEQVRFEPMLDRRSLAAVLARTDVFCLPSHSEGAPLGVLEAMACGCAVVATQVGEIEMMLDGGRAGLLVPPMAPARLADAIARLAADPELRARLGRAARSRVQACYPFAATECSLAQIYRSVLDRRMPRSPAPGPAADARDGGQVSAARGEDGRPAW